MDVKKIYTVLLRAAASASAGILVLLFVTTILNSRVSSSQNHYLDIAIGFILATEGLIIMDRLLNRKVPWFSRFRLRLVMQVSLSITWLFSISIVLFFKSYDNILSEEINTRGFILSIIFGIVFLFMINSVLVTRTFLKDRQKRELEREKLKAEKLRSDYNILQNQLNPHFLFNSLNVLLSEIRLNREAAVTYCESLSDVYRYVLQSRKKDTVSLRTERDAFEKHLYLQQVRFGNSIVIENNVEDYMLDYEIPPMTVQILVENAIKHNIISESRPLYIDVMIHGKELTVKNNLQLRSDVVSTGIGLKNIEQRYSLLTDRKVKIEKSEEYFSVTIPLLGD